MALEPRPVSQQKQYDYLLKFLLVGDSDVGKQEILSELEDGSTESHFCSGGGKDSNCADGYVCWYVKKKKGLLHEIGIYQRRYDCLVVLIVYIY